MFLKVYMLWGGCILTRMPVGSPSVPLLKNSSGTPHCGKIWKGDPHFPSALVIWSGLSWSNSWRCRQRGGKPGSPCQGRG